MALEIVTGMEGPLTTHEASFEALLATKDTLQRYGDIAQQSQWNELELLGTQLAGHAATLLDTIRSNTSAVGAEASRLAEEAKAWREALVQVGNDDSEGALQFRQALETAITNAADSPEEAQLRLEAFLSGQVPLTRQHEGLLESSRAAQRVFAAVYGAALSLHRRSAYLAAFHSARNLEPEEELMLEAADVAVVLSLAEDLETYVETTLVALHDIVTGNTSATDVIPIATKILAQTRHHGQVAGNLQGQIARAGIPEELRAELGPAVVRLTEASTRLGLINAYSAHLLAQCESLSAQAFLEDEGKTAELPHPSLVPEGETASLDAVPGMAEGSLVEVEGSVESLVIEDDPAAPKFSSFLVLRSFESGETLRLRAHMFSLRANGLAVGACCKIRGFVRRDRLVRRDRRWLSEGETGLDIDRVSLTKRRKDSWVDEITYQMRPFFMLYLDEMNLFNTPGGML